jgi:hypothetical protein
MTEQDRPRTWVSKTTARAAAGELHPSFQFIADPLIGSKEIPAPFEEPGVAKASRQQRD